MLSECVSFSSIHRIGEDSREITVAFFQTVVETGRNDERRVGRIARCSEESRNPKWARRQVKIERGRSHCPGDPHEDVWGGVE